MKPYLFKIGNFELRIYSLMYIIAFLAGIFIANRDEVSRLPQEVQNHWSTYHLYR